MRFNFIDTWGKIGDLTEYLFKTFVSVVWTALLASFIVASGKSGNMNILL